MNRKSQVTILGAVLMSSIIMSIVGATVVWGKPLIDKTTDKVHITNIIDKLQEIDRIIQYSAKTESSGVVSVSLTEGERILLLNNEITYESMTQVPIIASIEWVPLNVYEMPTQKEIFDINTNGTCNDWTHGDRTSYGGIKCSTAQTSLGGENFYFLVYDTTNDGTYDRLCFSKTGADVYACGGENDKIKHLGVDYDIRLIDGEGTEIIFLGNETENVGILGKDSSGIVIGKSIPGRNANEVILKLVYRALMDRDGKEHKYFLECQKRCSASQGNQNLKISFSRTEQTTSITKIYINLEFE